MPKLKARTPALNPSAKKLKNKSTDEPEEVRAPSLENSARGAMPASATINGQIEAASAAAVVGKTAEISEKIKELVRLAQEQGYLTYGDINDALPEGMATPEDLDEVLIKLRGLEVDI